MDPHEQRHPFDPRRLQRRYSARLDQLHPLRRHGLVFYFFLLRPQMQQQKAQRAKIAGLKRGDQVVTAGGLLGKVIKVDETQVELELAPNVKVRALRSTISDVVQPSGAPAND